MVFPDDGGTARTGDYWLIPARTVRLAYGLSQLSGTIEWPSREEQATQPDGSRVTVEVSLPQPPAGPVVHRAPLALLIRTDGGADAPDVWHPGTDCRDLFSPVTAPAIDLLGGDGQEALPGEFLPVPVQVALRAGAHPVPGARVRFSTDAAGVLRTFPGDERGPDGQPLRLRPTPSIDVTTDTAGVAKIYWQLQPDGPTTQTLSADALDGSGQKTGTEVVVSGLAQRRQAGWLDSAGRRSALPRADHRAGRR